MRQQRIREPPSGIAAGLTNFTISAWVNPSQDSAWSRVFDFGTGTYMFLTLSADGGPLRFAITDSGPGGEQQINGTGQLPLNTWSHVAVTLSGGTGTLYVNGTAVGTNASMTLNPSALGDTTQNWIGRSQYPGDPYLVAAVDDFQIYNGALTAAQIAALAGGQQGAGNVASYRFDETGGATAIDSSGNGRNGTIISTPAVPPTMDAYEVILSPGGAGPATPTDSTWRHSYLASQAALTGTGWRASNPTRTLGRSISGAGGTRPRRYVSTVSGSLTLGSNREGPSHHRPRGGAPSHRVRVRMPPALVHNSVRIMAPGD